MSDRINLTSPVKLAALLKRHGFHTRKRFGQNFLIDPEVVEGILDAAGISEGTPLLEIGPGVGTLTLPAAQRGARVVAVEIDERAVEVLSEVLEGLPNVTVVGADFLSLDLPEFLHTHFGDEPVTVMGNLPYYITTPIITKLFESERSISRIVLMVQKEVALRLQSPPGFSDYGAMSVFVQYHASAELIMRVPKDVFFPPPEVSSAVVRLTPRSEPPVALEDEEEFFKVVHCAFSKRRKTILNSISDCVSLGLEKAGVADALARAGIDPMRRAETLSMQEFADVAREIAVEQRS